MGWRQMVGPTASGSGEKDRQPAGSILAFLAAACFAAASASYLAIADPALDAAGPVGDYLGAVSEERFLFTILWGSQAVAALLALGVVPEVQRTIDSREDGWMPWLSALAYFGFGLMALDFSRYVMTVPLEAAIWANSGESVRQMVAGDFRHLLLDNDLLKYGTIGIWMTGVGAAAWRSDKFSRPFALVTLLAGLGAVGLAVEDLTGTDIAELLAASTAGVAVPVFFAWFGLARAKMVAHR